MRGTDRYGVARDLPASPIANLDKARYRSPEQSARCRRSTGRRPLLRAASGHRSAVGAEQRIAAMGRLAPPDRIDGDRVDVH